MSQSTTAEASSGEEKKRQPMTLDYINSKECPWPETVKERARAILSRLAQMHLEREALGRINMMDPEKIKAMNKLAESYKRLSYDYTSLAKELAYYISRATPKP
jgi:hypothetical protein